MKRIICIMLVLLSVFCCGFVSAEGITREYTYEESRQCTMPNGYEYLGYAGTLTFSADISGEIDYAGCEFKCVNEEIGEYYKPIDIKLTGKKGMKDFMLKLTGRPLRAGDSPYRLTPYVVSGGKKIYGESVEFSVRETCELMTNLRIVYDQIQKIEFTDREKEILDIILPVVRETIAAGEAGVEVTKDYIKTNYPDEIAKVKSMDSEEQRDSFDKKLRGNIDEQARKYFVAMVMN